MYRLNKWQYIPFSSFVAHADTSQLKDWEVLKSLEAQKLRLSKQYRHQQERVGRLKGLCGLKATCGT